MNDEEWNSLKLEVEEYLEADTTLGDGLKQVLRLNLQIGDNTPNEREAARNALKALLRGRDGTPFRKGKKSSVPTTVRVSIDKACAVVEELSISYFDNHPLMKRVLVARGGKQYETPQEYAKAMTKKTRTQLAKLYKEGSWDGNFDTL